MADSAGQGFVLPPGQGRPIDLGNFAMSVKATQEQTGGHFSLLEAAAEPAEFGPPLHLHRDVSESFYVLEGEYTIFLDQRQFTRAAMVGYFDEFSRAIHEGRADPEVLSAIAADYSIEVLGPVPAGYL